MAKDRIGRSMAEGGGRARAQLRWQDIRVARKIGLTVGALILLSIAVGAIAYGGFTRVVDRVTKADDANRLIKMAQDIRLHEKNYIMRRDAESRDLVLGSIQEIYTQIENTRTRFKNVANVTQIDRILEQTESFEKSFSQWVALAEQQDDLQRILVQEARLFVGECEQMRRGQKDKLEEGLQAGEDARADRLWKADAANRLIKLSAEARLAQLKYMARKDQRYVEDNRTALTAIHALVIELRGRFFQEENRVQADNVSTAARAYQAAFDSWVSVQSELESLKQGLIAAGQTATAECNALRASQKHQMEDEFAARADAPKLKERVGKADDANRMVKLVIESAVARRDFMLLPTEQNRARVLEINQELLEQAGKTKAKMKKQENVDQVEAVETATAAYLNLFDQYSQGRKKQNQEADVMVARAEAFVAQCEDIRRDQKNKLARANAERLAGVLDRITKADDANRLIKLVQTLRIQEKNYMLRKDDSALDEIHATIASVNSQSRDLEGRATSPATHRHIAAIRASARKYEEEFDAWVRAAQDQQEQTAIMVGAARTLLSDCESMRSEQKQLMAESVRNSTSAILTILAVAVLGGLTMGLVIGRGIARPLQSVVHTAEAVAAGNFTHSLKIDQQDEIGELADSINHMTANLNTLVGRVKEASIQLHSTTTQLTATSHEQQAQAASFGSSASQIATAVHEISATGNELVQTMDSVHQAATETAGLAGEGRVGLQDMESTMRDLGEATNVIADKLAIINDKASNITSVVETITKVADQTNLLSVNAAIEAERAGEYGVGFLVVAREIRRLADQTAAATLDIEHMVQEMVSAVSTGVMGMDRFADQVRRSVKSAAQISGQMGQIIQQVSTSTASFENINEGMRNQSQGADQINEAMQQLTSNADQTTRATEEYARAADDLNNAIGSLRSAIASFELRT